MIKALCQSCSHLPSANLLTLSEKREKQVAKGTLSGIMHEAASQTTYKKQALAEFLVHNMLK